MEKEYLEDILDHLEARSIAKFPKESLLLIINEKVVDKITDLLSEVKTLMESTYSNKHAFALGCQMFFRYIVLSEVKKTNSTKLKTWILTAMALASKFNDLWICYHVEDLKNRWKVNYVPFEKKFWSTLKYDMLEPTILELMDGYKTRLEGLGFYCKESTLKELEAICISMVTNCRLMLKYDVASLCRSCMYNKYHQREGVNLPFEIERKEYKDIVLNIDV